MSATQREINKWREPRCNWRESRRLKAQYWRQKKREYQAFEDEVWAWYNKPNPVPDVLSEMLSNSDILSERENIEAITKLLDSKPISEEEYNAWYINRYDYITSSGIESFFSSSTDVNPSDEVLDGTPSSMKKTPSVPIKILESPLIQFGWNLDTNCFEALNLDSMESYLLIHQTPNPEIKSGLRYGVITTHCDQIQWCLCPTCQSYQGGQFRFYQASNLSTSLHVIDVDPNDFHLIDSHLKKSSGVMGNFMYQYVRSVPVHFEQDPFEYVSPPASPLVSPIVSPETPSATEESPFATEESAVASPIGFQETITNHIQTSQDIPEEPYETQLKTDEPVCLHSEITHEVLSKVDKRRQERVARLWRYFYEKVVETHNRITEGSPDSDDIVMV